MKVVVVGNSELAEKLENEGLSVSSIDEWGEDKLIDAGVNEADAMVVVGGDYAVEIPIALDLNGSLRTILIADDAPDYVRGTVDVILSREMENTEMVLSALGVD